MCRTSQWPSALGSALPLPLLLLLQLLHQRHLLLLVLPLALSIPRLGGSAPLCQRRALLPAHLSATISYSRSCEVRASFQRFARAPCR